MTTHRFTFFGEKPAAETDPSTLAGGNETFSFGSAGTTQFGESTALGLPVFRLQCRDWGFMGGTVSDQLTFQWVQGSIVKERKTFAGSLFLGKNGPKIKKATKNQEATRKYHVYSIVPCFAPHAASKTLCSFLPFSCVTNLLETLELGEVFFSQVLCGLCGTN